MKSRAWCTTLITMLVAGIAYGADNPAGTSTKKTSAAAEKPNPIPRLAELRLDEYVIAARMINLPLPGKTRTVREILEDMEKWTDDEAIGGLLLDVGMLQLSLPDIEEIRAAVQRFRDAGKMVHAYLNGATPPGYLVACQAEEIAIAPSGWLSVPGIGRLFPFMKGYYQMVGVEFDVITAGRYKYPGFLNRREPSKYFDEEFGAILDSWYDDYKAIIAKGRNLSDERVREIIDIALFTPQEAQQHGLVDKLAYYDEYRDRILARWKMRLYKGKDRGLENVNSIQDLVRLINEEMQKAAEARKAVGPKIAVLHARGPIIDLNLGAGFASSVICRDDFVKVVDELRKNKSIKAVVLHVDSPGGSGYASDVIWQHLRQLDETKPLVVSMGSVAGSGGYYIACPARRIFAQPTTITGSIGVLGVIQSAQSMFNRRDWEIFCMQRGERAMLGAPYRSLKPEDRQFIQDRIDDFYKIFLDRVALTRKMPVSEVDKVAEGRIWTGRDALAIGLVDELGGLAEAVEAARRYANIPPSAELKIVHYPRPSSLGELFSSVGQISTPQVVETFMRATQTAPTVSLNQQIGLLTQRIEPLCWLAMPAFYEPGPAIPQGALPADLLPAGRMGTLFGLPD